ncbi:MAG: ADP/ATP-dependent (S)-NAD(P)H-hydrate dehydratase, partial [Candidatus Brocadiia bacterium]
DAVLAECERMDSIAVGPGLSQDTATCKFALGLYERTKCLAVFDADALNALAWGESDLSRHDGARILTPHPGEYRRLMPKAEGTEVELASALAVTCRGTVIYKGSCPVVCDGNRYSVIEVGTPALAHGGSGDVLTGLVASLCARLKDGWTAALLGTYLHARAGAMAGCALTEECVTSTDIVDMLPRAFAELAAERT